mmetsp:Transcript_18535/g.33473  ORF Transcript_18535/g.33473 Transcript_18535/m.33473 type:complete len:359 (+) Transcript_18535:253-1329(+)
MSRFLKVSRTEPASELVELFSSIAQDELKGPWLDGEVTSKTVTVKDVRALLQVLFGLGTKLVDNADGKLLPRLVLLNFVVRELADLEVVKQYLSTLTQLETEDKSLLTTLADLYDSFPTTHPARFEIFRSILQYAKAHGNVNMLIPHLEKLENYVESWEGVSEAELVGLYWESYEAAQSVNLKLKFLTRFLTSEAHSSIDRVGEAFLEALRIATSEQLALIIGQPILKQLPTPLSTLADLISRGDVTEFQSFEQANTAFFTDNNIQASKLLENVRVFSLAWLAKERDEFTFAEVGSLLQVPATEIDEWIVKAVTSHLISVKINQLEQKISVIKAVKLAADHLDLIIGQLSSWEARLRS